MTSNELVRDRLSDAGRALRTVPGWMVWRRCVVLYALFVACVLPLGYMVGVVHPELAVLSPSTLLVQVIVLAIHPAFGEELIFRVLLLPRQRQRLLPRTQVVVALVALVAYLVSHPVNAWLFRPQAWTLFTSPGYLACAALLGLTCTAAYWVSESIWPPVAVHWITAVTWLLCLGGQRLVGV